MPLFEYYCASCQRTFETLRPAKEADTPVTCPACQQNSSQRILSLFANSVKTSGATSPLGSGQDFGGSCCGGSCGCHN
jgi:putative FmdB family regulatory protein